MQLGGTVAQQRTIIDFGIVPFIDRRNGNSGVFDHTSHSPRKRFEPMRVEEALDGWFRPKHINRESPKLWDPIPGMIEMLPGIPYTHEVPNGAVLTIACVHTIDSLKKYGIAGDQVENLAKELHGLTQHAHQFMLLQV